MTLTDEVIAAARGCVGVRFRAHGRVPAQGLDCVGVAGIAFGRAVAGDYGLRMRDAEAVVRRIDASGLTSIRPVQAGPGCLVLSRSTLGQLHLGVLTDRGFVHADAHLRRIVETPGRPRDAIVGAWTKEG